MQKNTFYRIILFISFLVLTACHPNWQIPLTSANETFGAIDRASVSFYIEKSQEETSFLPLGQMLYDAGYTLIDEVSFITENELISTYTWDDIAETTMIAETGEVNFADGSSFKPSQIRINPSPLAESIQFSILDIAPTVANALGLSKFPEVAGQVIYETTVDHIVMILLDGTQYEKLTSLVEADRLSFFQNYPDFQMGLTVYPPITTSASAALLTGLPPKENGVYGYGYRTTESTTLFDLAAQNGKWVIAVEGNSLPFNLRNAETTLSGDRDGNGFSDDNVFENSMAVIQSGMPDLLYIHFHEIDDMGHTYGPESAEYESAIMRVDGYLEKIYAALPESTLLVIFADHGMHSTIEGGNHGTLMASDLIIPILFIEK